MYSKKSKELTVVEGNVWDYHPERYVVVPTNGDIKDNGEAVMGVGLARQARERFPALPKMLGEKLARAGNNVYVFPDFQLVTFPTKHTWKRLSDLDLIERSARQLWELAHNTGNQVKFVSGLVGTGAGGRKWAEVEPRVRNYFGSMDLLLVDISWREWVSKYE